MKERFYEEGEAEEILKIAAQKGPSPGSMSRHRLEQAAAELGISPAALEEAENEYRERQELESQRKAFDAEFKDDFYNHLIAYILINGGLVAWNLLAQGRLTFSLASILIWGFFLVFHAYEAFNTKSNEYQKAFSRYRAKKARKPRKQKAVSQAQSSLGQQPQKQEEEVQQTISNG